MFNLTDSFLMSCSASANAFLISASDLPTDEQLAVTHSGWRLAELRYLRPKGYGSRGAVPGGAACWGKRRYSLTDAAKAHFAALDAEANGSP